MPLDVKKGDRILFGKWSGTEIKIDGQDLLIMKESDIMGIIEGAAASDEEGRLRHRLGIIRDQSQHSRGIENGSQGSPF